MRHIFITRTNIFVFQTGKNISIGVGDPSVSHQWEGVGQGEGYTQINGHRVCAAAAKVEERTCRKKSVSELSVLV